jgi:UPF0755 protein
VEQGESSRDVGARLEKAGLIRSAKFWYILTRLQARKQPGETIKAGRYLIKMPATSEEILAVLEAGKERLFKLTVPEGWTLSKIAALLDKEGICGAEDFLKTAKSPEARALLAAHGVNLPENSSPEGFLYPDTWYFPAHCPPLTVIKTMENGFFEKFKALCTEKNVDFSKLTSNDIINDVILASIVEREYRAADEAPLMAGVFENRLKKHMRLESCATVEYVITEQLGRPHQDRLFDKDLQLDSPYNTYRHGGLPPGPICCPGAVALGAALAPEKTDYLFFRVKGNGRHYFSTTFDEHIKAGALLLKK